MVTCPSLSLDTNSRDKALELPDHHNTASGALTTNLLGTSEALIARTA
jgi:hypothetical protein